MHLVERITERIARATIRRRSLASAATAAFAGATGLAVGAKAAADRRCAVRLGVAADPNAPCNPPWGRYCNGTYGDGSPVGGSCDGSSCAGSCQLDDAYYPQDVQAGCWCSALVQDPDRPTRYSYWKCCDCQCSSIARACDRDEYKHWTSCAPARESQQYDCGCRERVEVTFDAVRRPRRGRR